MLECYGGEIFQPPKSSENRPTSKSFVVQFEFPSAHQALTDTNYPFHEEFADKTASHWNNDKFRRLKQKKRKPYNKRKPSYKSHQKFDITEFILNDPSSDDYDDFSSSDSSDDDVN